MCVTRYLLGHGLLLVVLPTLGSANSGHSVSNETVGAVRRMNSNARSFSHFLSDFFFSLSGIDLYELLAELLKHPCQHLFFFFFIYVVVKS